MTPASRHGVRSSRAVSPRRDAGPAIASAEAPSYRDLVPAALTLTGVGAGLAQRLRAKQ